MKVRDIMTVRPVTAEAGASIRELAQMMEESKCGEIPIIEDGRMVGVVTDRDIVLRAVAQGDDPYTTTAREIMTRAPAKVKPDASLRYAIHVMEDVHVRRLPVVDDAGTIVGILSMTDVCQYAGRLRAGTLVRKISRPMHVEHPRGPEVFPPYPH
ncbi:MAG: CBS domain-containing protein [Thermoanaerobaculia bacterium]|nr:CBS domain-containing protein [Thermoanaerobaculia bacterium]